MNKVIEVEGRVQVWLYTVGHGRLLLRRPKSALQPRRIDILFKNVAELHVFSYFDNLRVFETHDVDGVDARIVGADRRTFKLVADNAVGYVVAGAVVVADDELEYDEPSALME